MNATPNLIDTAQCLCLASRRAARSISRAFDRELRVHGLSPPQFTLLATLSLKGEQSIGELAAFVVAERTTMTRNIGLAQEKGLVTLRRNDSDARLRLVAITPHGRTILEEALSAWHRVQTDLTVTLGLETADALRAVVRSVAASPPGDSESEFQEVEGEVLSGQRSS